MMSHPDYRSLFWRPPGTARHIFGSVLSTSPTRALRDAWRARKTNWILWKGNLTKLLVRKILTFLLLTSVVTRDYFPLRTHYEIGLAEINGIESTITIISRLSCRFFWALLHFALSLGKKRKRKVYQKFLPSLRNRDWRKWWIFRTSNTFTRSFRSQWSGHRGRLVTRRRPSGDSRLGPNG